MVLSCRLIMGKTWVWSFMPLLTFWKWNKLEVPEHLVETNMISEVLQIQEFSYHVDYRCNWIGFKLLMKFKCNQEHHLFWLSVALDKSFKC